jgi:hypothetical protein
MKKITFLLVAFFAVATAFAQKAPIQFNKTTHSFGKIKQNIPATYVFTFKNVSNGPVVIEDATATCGCTKPEYTQGVIAKGASGKVKVTYNAADLNTFTKQVTVKIANVAEPIILNIGGEVVAASTAATKPSTAAKKKS